MAEHLEMVEKKVVDLQAWLDLPDVESLKGEYKIPKTELVVKFNAINESKLRRLRNIAKMSVDKGNAVAFKQSLGTLLVVHQAYEPNFADAELLEKTNCVNAAEYVTRKLKPGYIEDISKRILELSGFDDDMEDIDDAKN